MPTNSVIFPADTELQDEETEEPPTSPPEPRRSTRGARGQPPVRYGKVYTFGAIASGASKPTLV